jgi:protoporphyrinogen IX oxidase
MLLGYQVLKVLHLSALILWLGGSVTLFAVTGWLHTRGVATAATYAGIRRVWVRVTSPAMLVTWSTGLWMAQVGSVFHTPWVRTKLLIALLLTAWHGAMSGGLRRFASGPSRPLSGAWRWSLVPLAILLALAISMAVFKPTSVPNRTRAKPTGTPASIARCGAPDHTGMGEHIDV